MARTKRIRSADRTTAYAKLVLAGKRIVGESEKRACLRHINDMNRKDFDYVFDVAEAERHIELMNTLTLGEGAEEKKLHTRGFQNFIVGSIFGWRRKRSKLRRFRECYVQVGRQNGKSLLAGTLCNDLCTFSGYRFGRIFCTATKQDQANIVWEEVQHFIESDSDLAEMYRIQEHKHKITSRITGSYIQSLGRDTKSADGFRSILAIIDEYHAHPTNQMYDLMHDGQKDVDNALVFAATTAGFNLNAPCYEQYLYAKNVLAGAITQDSLFIYIAEPDDFDKDDKKNPDGIWKPETWLKSNPYGLWKSDTEPDPDKIARMAESAIAAKTKGGAQAVNFKTKSLNIWVTAGENAFTDSAQWVKCGKRATLRDIVRKNKRCYLGFDLSSGGDLTSIALLFPLPDKRLYLWSHSYMPKLRLGEHEHKDRAPYREWALKGLLTLTDSADTCGLKTDYRYIITELKQMIEDYGIEIIGCGYDPYNAGAFLSDLAGILDCDLTAVKQSPRSLSEPTEDLQLSIESSGVIYDQKNALLTWSVVNAMITTNAYSEIKVDKLTQGQRIDTIDAAIDAWKIYFVEANAPEKITAEQANAIMDEMRRRDP